MTETSETANKMRAEISTAGDKGMKVGVQKTGQERCRRLSRTRGAKGFLPENVNVFLVMTAYRGSWG